MKRCLFLVCGAALALNCIGAAGQTVLIDILVATNTSPAVTNDSLSALQGRLKALLNDSRFAQSQWGVKVVSLDTGLTLFESNADTLLTPASNAKLYTASLVLNRLGPDFRIKTSFYATAKPDTQGAIHGFLLVYGRGDPSFSAPFNGGDNAKSLQRAVDALRAAGVKRIDGDLIGDESYFRGEPHGVQTSALTFEDNTIELVFKPGPATNDPCEIISLVATNIFTFINRTKTAARGGGGQSGERGGRRGSGRGEGGGIQLYRSRGQDVLEVSGIVAPDSPGVTNSTTNPKPALWFVTVLKEELATHGVIVAGGVRQEDWLSRDASPIDWTNLVEVTTVQSPPLAEIVKQTLKPSQNMYARILLLLSGAAAGAGNGSTAQAALSEMRTFLGSTGIDQNMARLVDGSGLSRSARVTPSASVRLLTFMDTNRCREAFVDALPIAGVDGTLRSRFRGTAAAGNIRAKTGTLGGVNTLSGYVTTAAKEKLVFSIMLNKNQDGGPGIPQVDALAQQLAEFTVHTRPP